MSVRGSPAESQILNKDIVEGFGIIENSASRPNFGCFFFTQGFV